jgi:hypothetical protein
VDAHRTGLLGDARDVGLHFLAGHHHQVGEFVDNQQEVGHAACVFFGRRPAGSDPASNLSLKPGDIAHTCGGQTRSGDPSPRRSI